MSKFFSGFLAGVLLAYLLIKLIEKNQSQVQEIIDNWKKSLEKREQAIKGYFAKRKKSDQTDNIDDYSEINPESI